jgi:hypothetical protein
VLVRGFLGFKFEDLVCLVLFFLSTFPIAMAMPGGRTSRMIHAMPFSMSLSRVK